MSIVILRSTGPQNNPSHFTPEFCEKLRESDPVAYQTDVLGEFADPESGLLSPVAVRRSTRDVPLELSFETGGSYSAAVDPSEGAAQGNAWTLVIVKREDTPSPGVLQGPILEQAREPESRYRVAMAREFRGMRPDACWQEIAKLCAQYELKRAVSDQYAASANQDLAQRYGLHLEVSATTVKSKLEDFTNLATLIHTDRVELPPDRQFRSDLIAVRKRTTQNGQTIVLPRTSDGRHCDYAPALASAIREASRHRDSGPTIHIPSRRSRFSSYASERNPEAPFKALMDDTLDPTRHYAQPRKGRRFF